MRFGNFEFVPCSTSEGRECSNVGEVSRSIAGATRSTQGVSRSTGVQNRSDEVSCSTLGVSRSTCVKLHNAGDVSRSAGEGESCTNVQLRSEEVACELTHMDEGGHAHSTDGLSLENEGGARSRVQRRSIECGLVRSRDGQPFITTDGKMQQSIVVDERELNSASMQQDSERQFTGRATSEETEGTVRRSSVDGRDSVLQSTSTRRSVNIDVTNGQDVECNRSTAIHIGTPAMSRRSTSVITGQSDLNRYRSTHVMQRSVDLIHRRSTCETGLTDRLIDTHRRSSIQEFGRQADSMYRRRSTNDGVERLNDTESRVASQLRDSKLRPEQNCQSDVEVHMKDFRSAVTSHKQQDSEHDGVIVTEPRFRDRYESDNEYILSEVKLHLPVCEDDVVVSAPKPRRHDVGVPCCYESDVDRLPGRDVESQTNSVLDISKSRLAIARLRRSASDVLLNVNLHKDSQTKADCNETANRSNKPFEPTKSANIDISGGYSRPLANTSPSNVDNRYKSYTDRTKFKADSSDFKDSPFKGRHKQAPLKRLDKASPYKLDLKVDSYSRFRRGGDVPGRNVRDHSNANRNRFRNVRQICPDRRISVDVRMANTARWVEDQNEMHEVDVNEEDKIGLVEDGDEDGNNNLQEQDANNGELIRESVMTVALSKGSARFRKEKIVSEIDASSEQSDTDDVSLPLKKRTAFRKSKVPVKVLPPSKQYEPLVGMSETSESLPLLKRSELNETSDRDTTIIEMESLEVTATSRSNKRILDWEESKLSRSSSESEEEVIPDDSSYERQQRSSSSDLTPAEGTVAGLDDSGMTNNGGLTSSDSAGNMSDPELTQDKIATIIAKQNTKKLTKSLEELTESSKRKVASQIQPLRQASYKIAVRNSENKTLVSPTISQIAFEEVRTVTQEAEVQTGETEGKPPPNPQKPLKRKISYEIAVRSGEIVMTPSPKRTIPLHQQQRTNNNQSSAILARSVIYENLKALSQPGSSTVGNHLEQINGSGLTEMKFTWPGEVKISIGDEKSGNKTSDSPQTDVSNFLDKATSMDSDSDREDTSNSTKVLRPNAHKITTDTQTVIYTEEKLDSSDTSYELSGSSGDTSTSSLQKLSNIEKILPLGGTITLIKGKHPSERSLSPDSDFSLRSSLPWDNVCTQFVPVSNKSEVKSSPTLTTHSNNSTPIEELLYVIKDNVDNSFTTWVTTLDEVLRKTNQNAVEKERTTPTDDKIEVVKDKTTPVKESPKREEEVGSRSRRFKSHVGSLWPAEFSELNRYWPECGTCKRPCFIKWLGDMFGVPISGHLSPIESEPCEDKKTVATDTSDIDAYIKSMAKLKKKKAKQAKARPISVYDKIYEDVLKNECPNVKEHIASLSTNNNYPQSHIESPREYTVDGYKILLEEGVELCKRCNIAPLEILWARQIVARLEDRHIYANLPPYSENLSVITKVLKKRKRPKEKKRRRKRRVFPNTNTLSAIYLAHGKVPCRKTYKKSSKRKFVKRKIEVIPELDENDVNDFGNIIKDKVNETDELHKSDEHHHQNRNVHTRIKPSVRNRPKQQTPESSPQTTKSVDIEEDDKSFKSKLKNINKTLKLEHEKDCKYNVTYTAETGKCQMVNSISLCIFNNCTKKAEPKEHKFKFFYNPSVQLIGVPVSMNWIEHKGGRIELMYGDANRYLFHVGQYSLHEGRYLTIEEVLLKLFGIYKPPNEYFFTIASQTSNIVTVDRLKNMYLAFRLQDNSAMSMMPLYVSQAVDEPGKCPNKDKSKQDPEDSIDQNSDVGDIFQASYDASFPPTLVKVPYQAKPKTKREVLQPPPKPKPRMSKPPEPAQSNVLHKIVRLPLDLRVLAPGTYLYPWEYYNNIPHIYLRVIVISLDQLPKISFHCLAENPLLTAITDMFRPGQRLSLPKYAEHSLPHEDRVLFKIDTWEQDYINMTEFYVKQTFDCAVYNPGAFRAPEVFGVEYSHSANVQESKNKGVGTSNRLSDISESQETLNEDNGPEQSEAETYKSDDGEPQYRDRLPLSERIYENVQLPRDPTASTYYPWRYPRSCDHPRRCIHSKRNKRNVGTNTENQSAETQLKAVTFDLPRYESSSSDSGDTLVTHLSTHSTNERPEYSGANRSCETGNLDIACGNVYNFDYPSTSVQARVYENVLSPSNIPFSPQLYPSTSRHSPRADQYSLGSRHSSVEYHQFEFPGSSRQSPRERIFSPTEFHQLEYSSGSSRHSPMVVDIFGPFSGSLRSSIEIVTPGLSPSLEQDGRSHHSPSDYPSSKVSPRGMEIQQTPFHSDVCCQDGRSSRHSSRLRGYSAQLDRGVPLDSFNYCLDEFSARRSPGIVSENFQYGAEVFSPTVITRHPWSYPCSTRNSIGPLSTLERHRTLHRRTLSEAKPDQRDRSLSSFSLGELIQRRFCNQPKGSGGSAGDVNFKRKPKQDRYVGRSSDEIAARMAQHFLVDGTKRGEKASPRGVSKAKTKYKRPRASSSRSSEDIASRIAYHFLVQDNGDLERLRRSKCPVHGRNTVPRARFSFLRSFSTPFLGEARRCLPRRQDRVRQGGVSPIRKKWREGPARTF